MSAYMIDREHVRYLIEAATSRRINPHGGVLYYGGANSISSRDPKAASELGQMLWDENYRSVSHRYPGTTPENAPGEKNETYIYGEHQMSPPFEIDPVQVIKACHCYEYQSCEHPEWPNSLACRFIQSLIKAACASMVGYDDAEWGAPRNAHELRQAYRRTLHASELDHEPQF